MARDGGEPCRSEKGLGKLLSEPHLSTIVVTSNFDSMAGSFRGYVSYSGSRGPGTKSIRKSPIKPIRPPAATNHRHLSS